MRIAMALYADVSHDSRVLREATTLADAGHDVTIVCIAGAAPEGSPFRVIAGHPDRAGVLPDGSSPFLRDDGASRVRRAARRVGWLKGYVSSIRAWGRWAVASAGPVDAWHAHDLTGLAAVAPLVRPPTRLVYDSHEIFLETGTAARLPGFGRRVLQRLERRWVGLAAALVTVNEAYAEVLERPTSAAPHRDRPELPAAPGGRRRVGRGPERPDPGGGGDPGRRPGRPLPRRVRPPPRDRADGPRDPGARDGAASPRDPGVRVDPRRARGDGRGAALRRSRPCPPRRPARRRRGLGRVGGCRRHRPRALDPEPLAVHAQQALGEPDRGDPGGRQRLPGHAPDRDGRPGRCPRDRLRPGRSGIDRGGHPGRHGGVAGGPRRVAGAVQPGRRGPLELGDGNRPGWSSCTRRWTPPADPRRPRFGGGSAPVCAGYAPVCRSCRSRRYHAGARSGALTTPPDSTRIRRVVGGACTPHRPMGR